MGRNQTYWLWHVIVMLSCIHLSVSSFARDDTFSPPDETPGGFGNWIDRAHQEISNKVLQTSERFDAFFGDKRVKEEDDATHIIIAPTLTLSEGKFIEITCPLTINLALPYLKNRWHLMIETLLHDEQPDDDNAETGDDQERDVTVSLRYKAMKQARRWVSLDAGVKVRTEKILSPFGRVRFRRIVDFDPWGLRFTQFLFWMEDEGWGESSQFDIDRKLRPDLLFRISNQALWSESSQGLEVSQTYSLRWQLSGRRAVEIDLSGQGHTRPACVMDEYEAAAIFRRRLYRKWLFSEIKPGIRALREDNFAWDPFVMLTIECTLGEISAR